MALTMFDRARWTGKGREAEIFRQWLLARLNEARLEAEEEGAPEKEDVEGITAAQSTSSSAHG